MNSRPVPAPVFNQTRDERCGADRRRTDRRAGRRSFDPLFAATLVNQIAPTETVYVGGYQTPHGPRAGIAFNLSA